MKFKYLIFLLEHRFVKSKISKEISNGNLIRKCFQRELDVAVFMVRGISLGKGF